MVLCCVKGECLREFEIDKKKQIKVQCPSLYSIRNFFHCTAERCSVCTRKTISIIGACVHVVTPTQNWQVCTVAISKFVADVTCCYLFFFIYIAQLDARRFDWSLHSWRWQRLIEQLNEFDTLILKTDGHWIIYKIEHFNLNNHFDNIQLLYSFYIQIWQSFNQHAYWMTNFNRRWFDRLYRRMPVVWYAIRNTYCGGMMYTDYVCRLNSA